MQEKQLLRTWLKTKRMEMSASEVRRKSEEIYERLTVNFNWNSISSVHCYQPITSLNEVDTAEFIDFVHSRHIELSLQTQSNQLSDKEQMYDAVIVPTLGFDSNGFRLGWGGGFYDKFLATQERAIKIGLCFETGHIKKLIPVEPHDIKLDFVVTEGTIYNFR
jgi:5-formyltetrahydrofolate cyclo-ligase